MKTKALTHSLTLISVLIFINLPQLRGQSISGPDNVCPEVSYTYEVINIPNSWQNISIDWSISGDGYFPNYGNSQSANTGGNSTIIVKWNGQSHVHSNHYLSATINYDENGSNGTFFVPDKVVYEYGILNSISVSGPASIDYCNKNQRTYSVLNYGDGDIFNWTWPNTWTLVGSSNQSSITLKPDAMNGGTVSCTVRYSCSPATYQKNADINITRPAPDIVQGSNFPVSNLCPWTNYDYDINPVVGASSYTWTFPYHWTVFDNDGLTANATPSEFQMPGNSGNITVQASFTECPMVTKDFYASVLQGRPPTPQFDTLYHYVNYHCGNWYICPGGGTFYILEPTTGDNAATSFTWTVTSPWLFSNNQQTITTTSPSATIHSSVMSPGGGTIQVYAENCVGQSQTISTNFYEENPYWCSNPYPDYCSCCPPPGPGDPNYQYKKSARTIYRVNHDEQEAENTLLSFKIYPNPANSMINIVTKYSGEYRILIISAMGEVVREFQVNGRDFGINIKELPSGLYNVVLEKDNIYQTGHFVKAIH